MGRRPGIKRGYLWALLTLFGVASETWSQELSIYAKTNPPFEVRTLANGKTSDPSVEVVREIQRRIHNTDPIQRVPWARGYKLLETKPNVIICSVARTAQRNTLFHWIGPFSETIYAIYMRSDTPIVLSKLEDAKSLKAIGVVRDDARDEMLTEAGFNNLDRVDDNLTNVKKLMADRIDAFASSTAIIDRLMEKAGVSRDQVKEALRLRTSQTWLAISKGTPDATVAAWSEAFESMKKDKSFEKIMRAANPTWTPPSKAITQF